MQVEKLMTRQVRSCSPGDTLERASQLMWDGDCGCLPVCAGDGINRVVGVITDRDICMSALFQGKPLHQLSVSAAMAKQLLACKAGDAIADVERTMREARIRRLPVVDDQGALIGIIGLADLAREAASERSSPQQGSRSPRWATRLPRSVDPRPPSHSLPEEEMDAVAAGR